ncbi:ferredoxin [Microbispora sp. NEAU-D428]|uniref:ferredoxin n=1 Tax=Microbispora sitophila TaxID=2771537 RepID=UPI001866DDA4|nr:ferredoxin [Microbispora sitophila]MBE3016048.1 ferredoxin [Microbispora sitophila]
MTAELFVHARVCRGTGLCRAMAPALFDLGPDGKARILRTAVSDPEELALVQDIADCCPTEAIALESSA